MEDYRSTDPFRRWKSLLDGDLAAKCHSTIMDIAAHQTARPNEHSSAGELLDQALLFAYIALYTEDLDWCLYMQDRYNDATDKAVSFENIGLFGGACEIGWTIQHLRVLTSIESRDSDETRSDPLVEFDKFLRDCLDVETWSGDYDLISGLVGVGAYLLERPQSAERDGTLALVVKQLEQRSTFNASRNERTWLTYPKHMAPTQRPYCPNGHYNFGIAPGVPGIIRFLSRASLVGRVHAECKKLVHQTERWLRHQKLPPSRKGSYAYWLSDTASALGDRLAWCYGDLSVGMALFLSGCELARADLVKEGHRLIDRCLLREGDGVVDAGLCHGASGLAHIFHRMYIETGNRNYAERSRKYYAQAIDLHNESSVREVCMQNRFIDGEIGLALALISAVREIEPSWNNRLLLR